MCSVFSLAILPLVLLTKIKILYFKISNVSCITGMIVYYLYLKFLNIDCIVYKYTHDYFCVAILRGVFLADFSSLLCLMNENVCDLGTIKSIDLG